jgi:hypothetical protein
MSKNLGTDSTFETSMNFKGVQTFWKKPSIRNVRVRTSF